jgi:hypothetical protein
MPANEDARGDSNAPQQPPNPTLPPSIERTADSNSNGGKNESAKIQYCEEKPEHWGRSVEAICAILLVCITAYYAYYARQQWVEAQKTADAAICATKTAQKTLNQSIEQFRMDERAWLQLEISKNDRAVATKALKNVIGNVPVSSQEVFIKNYGRTIARNVTVKVSRTFGEESFGKDIARIQYAQDTLRIGKNLDPDKRKWIFIFPQVTPPAIPPQTSTIAPLPFPVVNIRKGEGNSLYSYSIGRIDYFDAFGVRHWKTFCFFSTGEMLVYCDTGNDEDDNPEISPNTVHP